MTQDSSTNYPQESVSICNKHHDSFDHVEIISPHPVSATLPSFSTLSSQSHESIVKANGLNVILRRLGSMDIPGKGHVAEYVRHQYRYNCKSDTLRCSLTALELFLSFIATTGKSHVEQISRQDIEAFVEHEQDRGMKIATVRTRLAAVYAFIRYMVEKGVIHAEVLVKKVKLRLPELLPRAIHPDDVKQLLTVLDHVRNRAMILVLLRTGMRIGELLATKVSDVNLEERKIAIWEGEKNRLGRVVYLSDDAVCALRHWLRKRDTHKSLLIYGQGHNSLTYPAARRMFCKYLDKAGLAGKGYTLHCLRHTFASELLNAGMRLECLQQLLGHSSLEVTRRYARLTDRTREEEYFRAMEIIERGDIDGDYQLDS